MIVPVSKLATRESLLLWFVVQREIVCLTFIILQSSVSALMTLTETFLSLLLKVKLSTGAEWGSWGALPAMFWCQMLGSVFCWKSVLATVFWVHTTFCTSLLFLTKQLHTSFPPIPWWFKNALCGSNVAFSFSQAYFKFQLLFWC